MERDKKSAGSVKQSASSYNYSFRSYGVNICLNSSKNDLLNRAIMVTKSALLDRVKPIEVDECDHTFDIECDKKGSFFLFKNGERLARSPDSKGFFKFFDSIIRAVVARDAADYVFLHAGVVSWKGKAILIPGDSFQGKSTLVAELVKNGAVYYSDEFAILDHEGRVHPFQRPLAMRSDDKNFTPYYLTIESLGGVFGNDPIQIGMILMVKYKENGKWKPELLSPGSGMLELIPFTISLGKEPEFSLLVLKKVVSHAIIAKGIRGSAEKFAKTLLDFVDKNVN